MTDKKEYTPREAAIALLDHVKAKAVEHLKKKEELEKASPQNQNAAHRDDLNIPQPDAPKANEKIIDSRKEIKLKKFMDRKMEKRAGQESKHDRCAEEVEAKNPDVQNPHAVCVAAGVRPAKWSK